MKKAEMLKVKDDVIEKCRVYKKIIKVDNKQKTIKSGPCEKIVGNKCSIFIYPSAKWRYQDCSMATHLFKKREKDKKNINPIKKSKRK